MATHTQNKGAREPANTFLFPRSEETEMQERGWAVFVLKLAVARRLLLEFDS